MKKQFKNSVPSVFVVSLFGALWLNVSTLIENDENENETFEI